MRRVAIMRNSKIGIILFIAIVSLADCRFSFYENKPIPNLDLQGHRGARGLFPENTLPAFKAAMDLKMTTIELDTVLTKDKKLIIHHDNFINPELCKWKSGKPVLPEPIGNFTALELKELDCGSLKNKNFPEQKTIPGTQLSTLAEFLQFVKKYETDNKITTPFFYNIETKLDESNYTKQDVLEYATTIVHTIEEADVVKYATVQSFVLDVLPEVKKLNPQIQTSALFAPSKLDFFLLSLGFFAPSQKIIDRAKELKVEIISPFYKYVDKKFINICRQGQIKVIPWTVNDKETMLKLIDDGVDGIISDYPDRLISVVTSNAIIKK